MQSSSRLDRLPPYLFAELERKIAAKKAEGVDVISLGIGDPDTPTPPLAAEALAAAAADPGTHRYPSNRGRPELREALARFYDRPRWGPRSASSTSTWPSWTRAPRRWRPIPATRSTPAARCWRAPRPC
jgi:LL-diaminopimelate aminotransferase